MLTDKAAHANEVRQRYVAEADRYLMSVGLPTYGEVMQVLSYLAQQAATSLPENNGALSKASALLTAAGAA